MRSVLKMAILSGLVLSLGEGRLLAQVTDTNALWFWKSGVNNTARYGLNAGKYGTLGVPYVAQAGSASVNWPGSKSEGAHGIDTLGRLYFFGGAYNDQNSFNQVWRYNVDSNTWTWVNGSSEMRSTQTPGLGKLVSLAGVPHKDNMPQSRYSSASAVDSAGCLWVFGGMESSQSPNLKRRNDLWKYNPYTNEWTYFNGNTAWMPSAHPIGDYGTKGVPAASNQPGARGAGRPGAWIKGNKFYVFSGNGVARNGATLGVLADFWEYDMVTNMWTWIGGGDSITNSLIANYGTKGVEVSTNFPQPRQWPACWTDRNGMFWMYGGTAIIEGKTVYLNDLWKYNPESGMWTWVSGDQISLTGPVINGVNVGYYGVYGQKGVPSPNNHPPSLSRSGTFVDVNGNLWLCFGLGFIGDKNVVSRTTEMWKYDPVANVWTWMFGSNVGTGDARGQLGNYTTNPGAYPGARDRVMTWLDKQGNFWTFGGNGGGTAGEVATRSDLWKLEATVIIPDMPGSFTQAQNEVCAGTPNLVYAVPPAKNAESYEWEYTGSGVNYTLSTTNPSNTLSFDANATSGSLKVRSVSKTGNKSQWRDTAIDVSPSPTVNLLNSGNQSICEGDSLYLLAIASNGVTYQWKNGSTNVGDNSDVYYAKASGMYAVTVTNSFNCSTTSDVAVLTVNPLPVVTVTSGGINDICTGESLTLTATSLADVDYQWMHNGVQVGNNANTFDAEDAGSYFVKTANTLTGCEASSAPVEVKKHARPNMVLLPGDTAICTGDMLLLEVAGADTGLIYRWKKNGAVVPGGNAASLNVDEAATYVVELGRAAIAGCDTTTNEVAVTLIPVPVVDITWDGEVLHATPGYESYQWYIYTQGIPGAVDSTFKPDFNDEYSVVVTDKNGCVGVSSVYNVTGVFVADLELTHNVRIYPNPTRDIVHIDCSVPVQVRLSGVDGRIIMSDANVPSINLAHLTPGLYFMTVTDARGAILKVERLIKTN